MKKHSSLLVVLAVFACTSLVVSNIVAGKLWQTPFGVVLTAAEWLFPVVYIIGDVIPEVYGLATARRIIWLGFAANLFTVVVFLVALWLPYPDFWTSQAAYETVLGFTPRLLVASFVAYLVGSNANAWVMVRMKKLTNGRWLWTRTITSTLVGQGLDSLLFVTIAFYGIMPDDVLIWSIIAQLTFKVVYEILATPFTYWIVGTIQMYERETDA